MIGIITLFFMMNVKIEDQEDDRPVVETDRFILKITFTICDSSRSRDDIEFEQ